MSSSGLDDFGQALALEVARCWRVYVNLGRPRLRLTLAAPDATAVAAVLHRRFPALDKVCEVRALPACVLDLPVGHVGVLESADQIYVCDDDDTAGIKAGLGMLLAQRDRSIDVTVRVDERGAELNEAFHGTNGRLFDDASGSLRVFGALDAACDPVAIREGVVLEGIASALHDRYVALCATNGDTPLTNASMKPCGNSSPKSSESPTAPRPGTSGTS
jgi:hypothetical protein